MPETGVCKLQLIARKTAAQNRNMVYHKLSCLAFTLYSLCLVRRDFGLKNKVDLASLNQKKPWPSLLGLHAAWALAVFELGLGGLAGFQGQESLTLKFLYLMIPFGVYGAFGFAFDLFMGRWKEVPGLLRYLPIAVALWIASDSFMMSMRGLRKPQALAVFALALLCACFLIKRGFHQKHRKTQWLGMASILCGAGGLMLFLLVPRNVEFRAPKASRPDGPNVVLITWDAVRADVLSLYGGRGIDTPNLDAFAAKSTVFDDMSAVAPITSPTHASIITGVVPPTHAIRSNGPYSLAPNIMTLAELFSQEGYATGGFVSAYPVRGEIGFDRGFDIYDDRFVADRINALTPMGRRSFAWLRPLVSYRKSRPEPSVDGNTLLERSGEFLEESEGPFLMWTHFFDAHYPYLPEKSYREKAEAMHSNAWPKAVAEEECGEAMMLYRAEIMELDRMLGDLLAQLEAKDPGLQNTVIFLLADHGHCFGEGGYLDEHKPSLLESTQHIPGILYVPEGIAGRSDFPTNQIDVFPTLAASAGLLPPEEVQGVNLGQIAKGSVEALPRWIFNEGFYMEAYQFYLEGGAAQKLLKKRQRDDIGKGLESSDQRKRAIRGGGWKYIQVLEGSEMLHDLTTVDELGQVDGVDLKDTRPEILKQQQALFALILDQIPVAEQNVQVATDRDQDMLQELGYMGAAEE